MTGRRSVRLVVAICSLPLFLFSLSCLGFFPWSKINCSSIDIDILSGRVRHSRYLFWMPVWRSVSDSSLTKQLLREDLSDTKYEWHPVSTVSPHVYHSPYYAYHGGASSDSRP